MRLRYIDFLYGFGILISFTNISITLITRIILKSLVNDQDSNLNQT